MTIKAGPVDGYVVEVVEMAMTSKAEGPVVGSRPVGDGWQFLLKRYGSTVAFVKLGQTVPESLGYLAQAGVPEALQHEMGTLLEEVKTAHDELNKHEHEPTTATGNPCKVCGFDRHHPWHQ